MLTRLAEGPLHTVFGTFRELLYGDGRRESIALVMGQVEKEQEILCRGHSHCLGAHVFNRVECDGRAQMALAQALIEQQGRGVIISLDHEGRGHGHLALLRSWVLQAQGWSQRRPTAAWGMQPMAATIRARWRSYRNWGCARSGS